MKLLSLTVLLVASTTALAVATDERRDLDVEFTQIVSGHSFQRDSDDRLYSAIIWDAEGWQKFLDRYRLPVAGLKLAFVDTHVFVMAFSDNLTEAFCDGFSHKAHQDSNYYYFDLHDTGMKLKRRKPADGMKYSSWVLVSIPRPDGISHVQVRDGAVGGLSEPFGAPPNKNAEQDGAGQAPTAPESK